MQVSLDGVVFDLWTDDCGAWLTVACVVDRALWDRKHPEPPEDWIENDGPELQGLVQHALDALAQMHQDGDFYTGDLHPNPYDGDYRRIGFDD